MLITTSPERFNEAFKKKAQDEILIVAHDDPGTEFSSPQPNAFDSLIRQAAETIRPVHFQNSPRTNAAVHQKLDIETCLEIWALRAAFPPQVLSLGSRVFRPVFWKA